MKKPILIFLPNKTNFLISLKTIFVQFPNCSAKVKDFFVFANNTPVFRVFYNIVSDYKRKVYTYKHFKGRG